MNKPKAVLATVAGLCVLGGLAVAASLAQREDDAEALAALGEIEETAGRFARLAPSGTPINAAAVPYAAADLAFGPSVSQAVPAVTSDALRSLPPAWLMPQAPRVERNEVPLRTARPTSPDFVDAVLQASIPAPALATTMASFEGMNADDSGCGCIPPDTVGAVGKTQYVQMVNSAIAVYDKASGARTAGPTQINAMFSALLPTDRCRTDNLGDPVVIYDQLADRWMISQFTNTDATGANRECIAISTTPDATGTWYVYSFNMGEPQGPLGPKYFQDYPHFGLWPDAYYMATHQFQGNSWAGAGVFAFERAKMLAGQPAQMVYFNLFTANQNFGGHLPATLDGMTPPPAGAPNYFVEVDDTTWLDDPVDTMRIWKFHVDWTTPANSTFGVNGQPNTTLPIADFEPTPCNLGVNQGVCIPQPASEIQLDPMADRLMYRLAYRNFGTHESIVANHTVIAQVETNQHGIRWYEIRNPGGAATIHQSGTLAPSSTTDPLHRWMASIGMNKFGDIGIGYSTSSNSDFPSIQYTGRFASDPPGVMTQGETMLQAGGASENPYLFVTTRGRWGDYSALSVDPIDDTTFWYTNEYFPTPVDAFTTWHTRIGSFKFTAVALQAPALSIGAGYENPDIDGSFTLNWTRPAGAVGPDLLQSSTSACEPLLSDDATAIAPRWTATTSGGGAGSLPPTWTTSTAKPQHANSAFWAQVQQQDLGSGSAILAYNSPIAIPASGATTLAFSEFYFNEDADTEAGFAGDAGFVEVSTDNGANWTPVYTNMRPMGDTPDTGSAAFAQEDLGATQVDLTAFAGQTIRLRFRFRQDSPGFFFFVQYGWYVDDLSVTNDLWGDVLTTATNSATLDGQGDGAQCFRVRTAYDVNGQLSASPFSNLVNVTVALEDIPPVARLTAAPTSGNSPLDVDFDGSTSSDADDTIVSYTFDFGDGTAPVTQATPTISHQYADIGTYSATLKVKDSFDISSATSTPVTIDVLNRAPVAALTRTPSSGNAPLGVSFDASGSSDPDGGDSIVSYTFDFGDGTAPVTQPGATIAHTYSDDGNYTATLTVTDSHGLASAPVTVPIVVSSGPPVARLSITPTAPVKGDGVTLDGSLSSVTDVVEYTFDPGDGSGAVTVLPPATATSHVYHLSGTYTVSLSVKDASNAVSSTTATLAVSNTAPTADLSASPDPTQGQSPFTVSFDASGSFDPDAARLPGEDYVESYEFDFGDGTVETVSVPAISHTYSAPGLYQASLVVYDHEGKKSSNTALWPDIDVLDGPPVAALSATPTSGAAPLAVVLDGAGSSDPDAGDAITSYTFDFGDGSDPVVRYGASDVQHTYAAPGAYDATLVVSDKSGVASAPATVTITVGPVNRAPIARATADKLSGLAPLTVTFNASTSSDTDGDAIVEYTFDFGDGSALVTQAQPTASHTYAAAGRYAGSVKVKDARGAPSSNSDAITIVVTDALTENTSGTAMKDEKGPFSGAISPWSLLGLGLLTLMRRRRRG